MTTRTIAAVLVALFLAACGSGNDDLATSDTAQAATVQGGEAPVEQYASLIAGHEGEWRDSVENIHDTCADSTAADACAAAYRTASEQAETIRTAISAAHDPACQASARCSGYVGETPAEIAPLVADIEAAATDYSAAFESWDATSCTNPLDWHCGTDEAGAMFTALGALTRQFDVWKAHSG
ncbi:MAG TPA: hypothetical protein VFI46_02205 [Jiangellaceae bacterium]|nr:hypothetical protein [Jiangellaceae bacterium]